MMSRLVQRLDANIPAINGIPAIQNPSIKHFTTYRFNAFSGPANSMESGTALPVVKALKNPRMAAKIEYSTAKVNVRKYI